MKKVLAGDCHQDNIYDLVDPTQFGETEFEAHVVKALTCLMPEYLCGVFAGTFVLEGERHSADQALIHKSLSHWFVIRVRGALPCHAAPYCRSP